MTRNVLTAEQVARRLGVKLETVYAYVSRGLLKRTLTDDGRQSRFASDEVEALAKRGRPRRESARQGAVEVSLGTAITGVRDGRLLFRGHDASSLARSASFERVAELLWTGSLPEASAWHVPPAKAKVALNAVKALPRSAGALERMCVAVSALAALHPLRVDLGNASVVAHARILLATYPHILPRLAADARDGGEPHAFAASLFPSLSRLKPTPARIGLLNCALVMLADHELATSTLAARVAASTRADPFAVVLAGLGAVSGPLHGRAPVLVHRMLIDAGKVGPERAVAEVLASGPRLPGFFHPVYQGIDPRAAAIFAQLEPVLRARERQRVAEVIRAGKESSGAEPNVDFGLAAVAFALEMPLGASEAIFAAARSAGFIAHALEEYGEQPLRFRARSIYLGP